MVRRHLINAEIAAQAIRDCARAMPVYGVKGQPAKFDGDDVRAFLYEYADSLVTPSGHNRRPRERADNA